MFNSRNVRCARARVCVFFFCFCFAGRETAAAEVSYRRSEKRRAGSFTFCEGKNALERNGPCTTLLHLPRKKPAKSVDGRRWWRHRRCRQCTVASRKKKITSPHQPHAHGQVAPTHSTQGKRKKEKQGGYILTHSVGTAVMRPISFPLELRTPTCSSGEYPAADDDARGSSAKSNRSSSRRNTGLLIFSRAKAKKGGQL